MIKNLLFRTPLAVWKRGHSEFLPHSGDWWMIVSQSFLTNWKGAAGSLWERKKGGCLCKKKKRGGGMQRVIHPGSYEKNQGNLKAFFLPMSKYKSKIKCCGSSSVQHKWLTKLPCTVNLWTSSFFLLLLLLLFVNVGKTLNTFFKEA